MVFFVLLQQLEDPLNPLKGDFLSGTANSKIVK